MSFINQSRIMSEVNPLIESIREGSSNNILLQGPAGCGKTTLANKIAKESTTGEYAYQIPKNGDINWEPLNDYRIHLIDEIHMFRNFENLYSYMDNGEKVFLFCTTEYGETPEPFLSRCIRFTFEPYDIEDLAKIVKQYSKRRGFTFKEDKCYNMLAKVSRGSPRLAKQRFDRAKLMITYYDYEPDAYNLRSVLNNIGIFNWGYTNEDFRYLEYLKDVRRSSLNNISLALQIDKNTIQKEIEPFLLERKNIKITPRGREFLTWPKNTG